MLNVLFFGILVSFGKLLESELRSNGLNYICNSSCYVSNYDMVSLYFDSVWRWA